MTRSTALGSLLLRALAGSGVALSLSLSLAAGPAFAQSAGDPVPGELLVKFRPGQAPDGMTPALAAAGAARVRSFLPEGSALSSHPRAQWRHVVLTAESDDAAAMAAIAADPAVESVIRNVWFEVFGLPNDPEFSSQWGLHNTGQTGGTPDADIDAPEAWDIETGDPSVVIAITDSGVDYRRPDLAANMWRNPGEIEGNGVDDDGNGIADDVFGANFVPDVPTGDPLAIGLFALPSHGTHVAGIAGAVGNNSLGVTGVAQRVRLMAVKWIDFAGMGTCDKALDAVYYAILNGADVINASWGGPADEFNCAALEDAIRIAGSQNILFVAAAGNDGTDNDVVTIQPASFRLENLIAVAATDRDDERAVFNETMSSNFGDERVQVAAPGKDVLSTVNSDYAMHQEALGFPHPGFSFFMGTSMAAPHVSGVAALLLSRHPNLTPGELKTAIVLGGDQIESLQGKVLQGRRLNAAGALIASDSAAGSELWVCDDGIDNDGDGLVDFPDDPECSAVFPDASEATPGTCGLGFELAFLLPLLLGLHARRCGLRAGRACAVNRRTRGILARLFHVRIETPGPAVGTPTSRAGTRRRTSFCRIAGKEPSMTTIIGQRGRTRSTTLSIGIAAAVLIWAAAPALATPVEIFGGVFSPDGPIGPDDPIELGALSVEDGFRLDVFRFGGIFTLESTLTVLEDSFEIRWQFVSESVPPSGVHLFVRSPVGGIEEVGPLAPGTYLVTIEWQHIGDPDALLDPEKNHGTGAFSFTVVPEPAPAALLMAGLAALLARCAGTSRARQRAE